MKKIPQQYDKVERLTFGNTDEEAKKLINLIITGKKTATCSLYEPDEQPSVGELFVIVGANDEPACAVEITEVKITQFLEVDEAHAIAEGEGDLSLTYWQNMTRDFFESYGLFSYDMKLICMRFKLHEIFS